jgi:hypothetical protein
MDCDLVLRHDDYAKWLAKKVAPNGCLADREDVAQDARLLLLKASSTYTATKGSFIAYTKRHLLRSLQERHVAALMVGIRIPRYNLADWQDKVPQIAFASTIENFDVVFREVKADDDFGISDVDKFWELIRGEVTTTEYAILEMFYRQKLSRATIATTLKIHKQSVTNMKAAACKKLRRCEHLRLC